MVTLRLEELKGHWALVTGASSGIGREFAVQLAAAGVNLAVVARRADLLNALASELSERHGIRVLALRHDLAEPGQARRLRQRLQDEGVTLRLLVNNAALGRWARFEETPAESYEEIIHVNAAALVSLCREFLPDLSAHPSSGIINVSSPAAYQPVPYMAVYAASKTFVHSFSQGLHAEWRARGVLVQTLVPGPISTELEGATAGRRATRHRSTPDKPVRAALAGLEEGATVVVHAKGTYWQRLFALLPAGFVIRQVGKMFARPDHGNLLDRS
ncbi:MAG: SDR family NAD(P)-dependent oxidoreductase [Oligoflexia bacterium]|nr:SDR family NAD(P)-dependent oxidoreductase [Oligoflexia bacterium]